MRCVMLAFNKQTDPSRLSKTHSTLDSFGLPLPQMWAPGNTGDSPTLRQPGRTCDSPSGCRPHTGAPLHHPVKTELTSVCASVRAETELGVWMSDPERNPIHPHTNTHTHMPISGHRSGETNVWLVESSGFLVEKQQETKAGCKMIYLKGYFSKIIPEMLCIH